jgi:hypothetical protein
MKKTSVWLAIMLLLSLGALNESNAFTIDFEDLPDSTPVTDQYSSLGATFSGGTIVEAGVTLFEDEYPPNSGSRALLVDAGPLTLSFNSPVTGFSAYGTYAAPLTLTFYDLDGIQIGTLQSIFSSNLGLSGDTGSSPNELFSFQSASGISRLVFATSSDDSSYVLDDVSGFAVPEPAAWLLFGIGTLAMGLLTRRRTLPGVTLSANREEKALASSWRER